MFTSGDTLIIIPMDPDDPEALAHAGERCRFERYVTVSFGSRYAVVRFSPEGHRFYFRPGDLGQDEKTIPQTREGVA